jgi:hypothetical protein
LFYTRRDIVAAHTEDIELLPERDAECIESDHTIEIDSLGDFVVESFFDEFLVLAEDTDIDHRRGFRD